MSNASTRIADDPAVHDLIVIGGGAAGAAAASVALAQQLDVLAIYERPGRAGHTLSLPHQLLGESLAGADVALWLERELASHAGCIVRDYAAAVLRDGAGFTVDTGHHGRFRARAVIVATGARSIELDVPGARELLGAGVAYSVTPHLHTLQGRRVAIVGGTARALRGAAQVARVAASVALVVPPGAHPGALHRQALERLDHVELLEGYEPRAIGGDTFVTSLTAAREHEVRELAVEAVFVELGLAPNSAIVRQLAELDPAGFVRVDSRNRTSVAGLFAAGDVTTTRAEHVLVAMGDGARAAISACEDLLFSQ